MSYTTLDNLKGKRPRFLRDTAPAIPYKNLTLCAGVDGSGKSTFICGLVLDLLQNELRRNAKQVHLCMPEDDMESTTLPRLVAAGAKQKDLARIHFREGRPWSFPGDLGEFSAFMLNENVALAVLDPIDHLIDGVSSIRGKKSLDELALALIANRSGAAILLVGHTNKGRHKSISATLGGSRRLLAATRSRFVWGAEPRMSGDLDLPSAIECKREPANPCSVLCCIKNSLGEQWEPVLYETIPVENPFDPRRRVIVHQRVALADGSVLPYGPLAVVN